jgi:hypothetical protein
MFAILRSKASVTAFALGVAACMLSTGENASAQDNAPVGCWRHESEQGRYKNFLEICLKEGGKGEVITFEDGNGWGRNARWEADGTTLSLAFASDHKITCKYGFADRARFALSECSISDYSRVFTREDTSGNSTRQSICWSRQYPDNGDFEVARIAERTSTIIELENKQVSEHEPYAEADTVVVVWHKVGSYACVQSPTFSPEQYFWVDRNALKNVSLVSGEDPWPGSYRRTVTVKITSAADGKYDVYGEIDHTQGDGPGWGYTISNEIFVQEAKPQTNAIQVTLRRNISVAGSKAPKGLTSPGFIDYSCKPVMFVKGPVLLIQDTGHCGDGSFFEGYYLRNQ